MQGLDGPGAPLALGRDELVGDFGMVEDLLAEQQRQRVHIEGELGVLHVVDDGRVRDDDAQAAGRQREQLRERDVVVGLGEVDEGVGVEVVVGLVDDDHRVHRAGRLDGGDDVLAGEGVAHRVVGIQKHHDIGVGADGGDEVAHVEGQVVVVGHGHVGKAQDVAVHPVHLEGRRHGDHLVALAAEGLQQVADGLVGAVGGRHAVAGHAHVLGVLREEAVGLGVDGQELGRDLGLHLIHEPRGKPLGILVHIVAEHAVAPLIGKNALSALDVLVNVECHGCTPLRWLRLVELDEGLFVVQAEIAGHGAGGGILVGGAVGF